MRQEDTHRNIQFCINKLKVMVLKTIYKESTNLEYLIQSYTSQLREALDKHSLKHREEEKS
jgi:hypothetical protein